MTSDDLSRLKLAVDSVQSAIPLFPLSEKERIEHAYKYGQAMLLGDFVIFTRRDYDEHMTTIEAELAP